MRKRPSHFIACWLAGVAALVNVTAASAGLVHCEDPQGQVAVETGCDHDHCFTTESQSSSEHGHVEQGLCICDECACEDTPIESDIATITKRLTPPVTLFAQPVLDLAVPAITATWLEGESSFVLFGRPPPFSQTLCALRTVVLLI